MNKFKIILTLVSFIVLLTLINLSKQNIRESHNLHKKSSNSNVEEFDYTEKDKNIYKKEMEEKIDGEESKGRIEEKKDILNDDNLNKKPLEEIENKSITEIEEEDILNDDNLGKISLEKVEKKDEEEKEDILNNDNIEKISLEEIESKNIIEIGRGNILNDDNLGKISLEEIEKKDILNDDNLSKKPLEEIKRKDVAEKKRFFIKEVRFNNVRELKKDLDRVKKKFEGRELSFEDLGVLIEEANNVYLRKGYITTRVKLKVPQSLEDGYLDLMVINGYIEKINLNSNTFREKAAVFTAFPLKSGKLLKLSDIEQGINQINSLQSNNAEMKILPGSEYGYSVINITNEPSKRFSLVLEFDNMGQESTEKNRGRLNFYLDNLFGLNDSLSLNYQNTLNSDQKDKNSINYGINMSVPLGYYTLSSGISKSSYLNKIKGKNNVLTSSGNTLTHYYNVKKVLFNNALGSAGFNVNLSLKDDKHYFEGAQLYKGSKKLAVLKLGATRTFKLKEGRFFSSIGYHKGLDEFNAEKNELAQFEKFTFNTNFIKFFRLGSKQFSYNLKFNGQYSNQVLYGTEKISIGDLYTVRGFKNNFISGEKGMYFRNTLTYMFDKNLPVLRNSSIFFGADYGLAKDMSYKEGSKYEKIEKVAGLSTGYKYSSRNMSLDLTLAKPIEQPKHFKEEDYRLYMNISLIY